MADFDNRVRANTSTATAAIDVGLRAYMLQVYNYMLGALALTGATAWVIANVPAFSLFFAVSRDAPMGSPLGRVGFSRRWRFVLFLSFRIQKMSFAAAQIDILGSMPG